MVIKILPSQIPMFWEVIKFAAVSADEVSSESRGVYLNELLHSLLNNKSQCFIRFNNEKKILALLITKLLINKMTGSKSLFLQVLYSWKSSNDQEWLEEFEFIKEFAKREKCKRLSFESRNARIWELTRVLGFKETHRGFDLRLEVHNG